MAGALALVAAAGAPPARAQPFNALGITGAVPLAPAPQQPLTGLAITGALPLVPGAAQPSGVTGPIAAPSGVIRPVFGRRAPARITHALDGLAVMGNQLISLDAPRAPVFGVTAVEAIARAARLERRAARRRNHRRRLLDIVRAAVTAADQIASFPYRWGGGHGSFADSGYDCSGSVSYVLHGAGQLAAPLSSVGLMGYGEPGPGRFITIYTSPGHAFMVIRGRRYDTSGQSQTGSRWQASARSTAGFVARHPTGL